MAVDAHAVARRAWLTLIRHSTLRFRLTRTGVAWWALGFSLLLLVLVLIFFLQNLDDTTTSFFGLRWTIPLGLDLLLATLLGGVIAFLLGAARMLQIRVARRYARMRK